MSTDVPGELDMWLLEVRDDLDAVPTPPPAGLADVFARAQRIDPTLALRIDEAERLDAIDDAALDRVAEIGSLDTLLASAKAVLSAEADAVERHGPPPQRVVPQRRSRPVFAAVAVLAAGVAIALATRWAWQPSDLDDGTARDYSGASQTTPPQVPEPVESRRPIAPPPRSRVEAVPAPEVAPEPEPAAEPEPPARRRAASIAREPAPSLDERLDALDAEARSAWKRGELAAAQAAFESLVRAGGTKAIADLAFGDLFELARQRHDAAAEAKLWERYVRRFPSGRYVDEARAGLCRRASGDAASRCWRAYLDDRPRGTYRDQARAALGDAPSAPGDGE